MTKDYMLEARTYKETVLEIEVVNQGSRDLAADVLLKVKQKQKEVENALDPQCKSAYEAWQTALGQKKKYLAPYIEAENELKVRISSYDLGQRRLQEEMSRRAQEEARKEEAKLKAKLEKKAAKAEDRGDTDLAGELRDEIDSVFAPTVVPNLIPEKSTGITSTEDCEITVVDLREALKWLIASTLDVDSIVTIKVGPIKSYVKLTKATVLPGIRIEKKMRISANVTHR
jgi:hypothetical protein